MTEQEVASSVAQRLIIKFLTKEGAILSKIFTRLQAQFGDEGLSQARRRRTVNPDVLKTGEIIRATRQITVLELSQEVRISVGSAEEILHNELVVSKVSANSVPRLLTTEHRERLSVTGTQLLQQYERKRAEFLDSVVTSDETWVHYFTPESKRA
ncbi:hypothetical protein Cfor_05265, partial [Coptotermes formosanus]